MSNPPLLELQKVSHLYQQGKSSLQVLCEVSLSLVPGEIVALVGPSGAGKSTLLHIAGLLESPSEGAVLINGESSERLSDRKRTQLRRKTIGFVYQFHHLLPEFSALENVVMPQLLCNTPAREAAKRAEELIAKMKLTNRVTHLPSQLSGGEQQRIAIARALANRPQILLADEPTGNLDTATSDIVFQELVELIRHSKTAALIATHNSDLASRMDRKITLVDGNIVN
ncbi:MAG: ABC transporter ATP-binding protein [Pseudomonadota bacterium]